MGEESLFSIVRYADEHMRQKRMKLGPEAAQAALAAVQEGNEKFRELTEEIRMNLIHTDAKTEEDKNRFGEQLNRAVLGFREDRELLLNRIGDLLVRRGRHNEKPPDPRYGSMAEALFAEIVGMNVLELVMRDRDGLEEIQVNGVSIFEVRGGVPKRSPYRFSSLKEVERIQQNLVLFNRDIFNLRNWLKSPYISRV